MSTSPACRPFQKHPDSRAERSYVVYSSVRRSQARVRGKRFKILLRIQGEQKRLGGLLKKALTEREEKAALRRTLVEMERNAIELRRAIAHLVLAQ